MKKIVYLFISLFLLLSFSKAPKTVSVKGYITQTGNRPFTTLCLISEDNKEYGLSAEGSVLKEILDSSENAIIVTGDLIIPDKNSKSICGKDGTIIINFWKVAE